MTTPESILNFWFGDKLDTVEAIIERSAVWYVTDSSFDEQIRERFGELLSLAQQGQLSDWLKEPRSCLALVVVLDQFPRNLYRESPRSFVFDRMALQVAVNAIDRGFDLELAPIESTFLYLPFEHDEDIESQNRCVSLFQGLVNRSPSELRRQFESSLSFAVRHRDVIERFGRFPHRNRLLARRSTEEELRYLESGGETFDGSG